MNTSAVDFLQKQSRQQIAMKLKLKWKRVWEPIKPLMDFVTPFIDLFKSLMDAIQGLKNAFKTLKEA